MNENIKYIGKTISVVSMWTVLYFILRNVLITNPILGWILIIAIVITHDIW